MFLNLLEMYLACKNLDANRQTWKTIDKMLTRADNTLTNQIKT